MATRLALVFLVWVAFVGCRKVSDGATDGPLEVIKRESRSELSAFRSEAELRNFLRDLAAARSKRSHASCASCVPASCDQLGCGVHSDGCGGKINCGPCGSGPKSPAEAPAADMAEAPAAATESITNVQHAGVDEGSIVKLAGDYLLVLRRGRLFSLRIAGRDLAPVSSVEAFGPEVDPKGTWYDELLVSDQTVVVIGYSYERGGTEIGLFDLDRAGKLAYRATYHLRSNDYYSSRNYASRLIEKKLIFYAPLSLTVSESELYQSFPALRKWRSGAAASEFRRTVAATEVYRPIQPSPALTLHTVTSCDLGRPELACSSTVVMGPSGRVFYVSPTAVYVWVTDGSEDTLLYRMPLDRTAPTALHVKGSPVDQFSFLEDGDRHLNVLLRADAVGDGMWDAEVTRGDVALLRFSLDRFSNGSEHAPRLGYTALPKPQGPAYATFQNRFVGDRVLYGTGSGWGKPEEKKGGALFAYKYAADEKPVKLRLTHGVDRIEALGSDAVVVGTDGKDLHFSPIALGPRAFVATRYTRADASQGELRSHGFFYRRDDERRGLLGLPIRDAGRPGYEHLVNGSASVLFLENHGLRLTELGALDAEPESNADDGCRASCVDWYGNARPIFVRGRIFALLGYELVEGALFRGRIRETRRVSFAPNP